MSVGITDYHVLGPVQVGATTLGGITGNSVNNGIETYAEAVSGEVGSRLQSITAIKPGAAFTTMDIARAFAAAGNLPTDLSSSNLTIYASKRLRKTGLLASGASHYKWVLDGGLLYPTRLTCAHRQMATLEYAAIGLADSDGNAPITGPTATALPTAVDNNGWTLQSASFSGVGATDLTNVDIDFGVSVQGEGSNSELYDSQAAQLQINPVITITGVTPAYAAAVARTGAEVTATITLRKYANRSTFSGDTYTFTATGLAYRGQDWQGGQDSGQSQLLLACTYDGTNAPVTAA